MPFNYQNNRANNSLISQERIKKLELLIHLIRHSRQALIVCGPNGIGKSTLLNALQDYKNSSLHYCLIMGHSGLNFEQIQKTSVELIDQTKSKKIVLLIDNAGCLEPNLIKETICYTLNNPNLQVIFALTNDELASNNQSINFIDDCHLIEIPALSKTQCGEFLEYLTLKTPSKISFNDINETFLKEIYLETEGIPGNIIAKVSNYDINNKYNSSLLTLVAAVVGLITLALVTQWLSALQFKT